MEDLRRTRLLLLAASGLVMSGAVGGWLWYHEQKQASVESQVQALQPPPPVMPAPVIATPVPPSTQVPAPKPVSVSSSPPASILQNKNDDAAATASNPPASPAAPLATQNAQSTKADPPVATVIPSANASPSNSTPQVPPSSPPPPPVSDVSILAKIKQDAAHKAAIGRWKESRRADLYTFLFNNGSVPPEDPIPQPQTTIATAPGSSRYPATRRTDAIAQANASKVFGDPSAPVAPTLYRPLGSQRRTDAPGTDWVQVVPPPPAPQVPQAPNPHFPNPDLVPPPPPEMVEGGLLPEQLPPPPNKPEVLASKLRLVGIMGDSAIFYMPGRHSYFTLVLGHEVDGIKLVAINDGTVVLEEDGVTETKTL